MKHVKTLKPIELVGQKKFAFAPERPYVSDTELLWQNEKIFFSSDEYFDCLLSELRQAKFSIDLEVYIFDYDNLGYELIDLLIEKSSRDSIRVRLLLDGVGSSHWQSHVIERLQQAGVEFRIYHPLPWRFSQYRWARKKKHWIERLIYLSSVINRRNHRKLCIIDNKSAWVGSRNISNHHLTRERGGDDWRDCGVRLEGVAVRGLLMSFDEVWFDKRNRQVALFKKAFLVNNTVLRRKQKNNFIVERIHQAEKRFWISTAYFAPPRMVLDAMINAARRQVDVRIVTGSYTDVIFFPLVSSNFYSDLIGSGVKVYEYQKRILHSKVMLIDNEAILGSSNLNHRSFLHDLELDICLDSPVIIEQLEKRFAENFEQAQGFFDITMVKSGFLKRMLSRFYRLIIHWL